MSDALYAHLFDDAALFPPGNAPMGEAVPAHRAHLAGRRALYVGPFVVSDARTAELRTFLSREDARHDPLAVVVTVPGGPDAVESAVAAVRADPGLRLAAVEVAAEPGRAGDAAEQLDRHLPEGAEGYVELSRVGDVNADLAALAATGHRAKYRTGGLVPEAHPDEAELARLLHAAVAAGVPFKCTAGLHRAVRHTTAEGFEQHGFLNVLLATHALVAGADPEEAAGVLAERDGPAVAARIGALTREEAASVRHAFRSFGTCSVTEPLEDLVVLGALPAARTH
ncbi:hypothetical protein [Nocardiopsis sp. NRRL B-16309]|uniref:hypothetical protein n=1 Tax=Nocardiopsis sp. NRRL B-16309 TaxID=1519494 RepID=UPI0006AE9ACB|nr:hypothetical protein [Nocardiopsis sp. NRRL B-16309]KOX15483.1 hypothetical protein ADL05_14905 [Nocardiopsis sp. NRRL B-16309]